MPLYPKELTPPTTSDPLRHGNGIADAEANIARERHPQPPSWLAGKVAREVADAQEVILHAARVLPLWPRVSNQGGT